MKTSNELASIAKALNKAQGESKDLQKDKQGYGYKYAKLESILSMLRPIIVKHGLSVIQTNGNDGNLITVTTRILHESGEWIEDTGGVEYQPLNKMNNAQSVGSIITYLRRYQISSFFNITSDEDVDGKEDAKQTKKPNNQQPQKPMSLNEYLKIKNVKDKKSFTLKYGINSTEAAKKLMSDRAKVDELIKEFLNNPPAPLP